MLNHPRTWSDLSSDLLESIFEKLSFADFHRAKLVCSTWNSSSKRTVSRKSEPPWLILFPDSEENVCLLFNPEEDRIYTTERDFSKIRFLANSGKWFLVVDSGFSLCIIDVFNENRKIDLPPLEALLSSKYSLKRVRDKEFRWGLTSGSCLEMKTDNLRGLLWVDEKTEEFVVVWFFDPVGYLFFCKKGDTHYTFIPLYDEVPKLLSGFSDLVLWCYRLYIATTHRCVRVLDLSGHQGFEDVTGSNPKPMFSLRKYYASFSIAVTKDGEVLLVESTNFENRRSFRLYKKDPNADLNEYSPDLLEVDSVGDEALLLDLGIIVPANHTIGIKPNTVYFTRHDRARLRIPFDLDICVFNLATNTLKHFPQLAGLNLKDARWFLPFT
ncbi:F-box-like domain superfamily [Arabidopsis thaliana x Arabidopsis arenosa]|uniref:F-box-like domain superfamily n=1 Tax=Arabidopsis thaliana x Arabidopsis arenosa TaxID=1240361 RepID=A0A8T2AWA1_9BRAS|nr:F-box-like domain superfamily [Arabidopsis thaliana x Arabidopsis arenosa]